MKKQFRLGFTLVELLVVISIIGMLAGLLLPAVNAAREAGRRAVCMNNQSQLALALINYDSAKGYLPPMRGEIGRKTISTTAVDYNVGSWIANILAYLELNQLHQNLTEVNVNSTTTSDKYYEKQLIRIKSLLCPSADSPEDVDAGTHYICNGGYQNAVHTTWGALITAMTTTTTSGRFEPGKVSDSVFFDHQAYTIDDSQCKTKSSIDYISSHSGTSNVILLSENERPINTNSGARWAVWSTTSSTSGGITYNRKVHADDEERLAFCYPINKAITLTASTTTGVGAFTSLPEAAVTGGPTSADWSYQGYSTPLTSDAEAQYGTPLFINQGRGHEYTYSQYRRARPGSNHPGIVLAAFADRSVRPVNENMDRRTFVWLCQPNSGQVISGDAF